MRGPDASGAAAAELNYSLYLLAVPLADATFTLDQNPAAYRMTMSFHTIGLADLFASDQFGEHITGRIENDRLAAYTTMVPPAGCAARTGWWPRLA